MGMVVHGENQIDIITSTGVPSPNVHSPVTGYKKSLADSTISDAELERKLLLADPAYGGGYSKGSGGYYYGPAGELLLDGDRTAAGGGPGPKPEGGDESSPKRISLDDRINIVLGMNGTAEGAAGGKQPPGKHHLSHLPPHHLQHHQQQHHGGYGEYPPSSHDLYQQQPPGARNHLPHMNYPAGYGGQEYGAYGYGGPPPRGPPPSWAPRSHPYQGYPMAFVGPPLNAMRPGGDMVYRPPYGTPTIPTVSAPNNAATDGSSAKSQVKQVGNVLEIVPSSTPLATATTTTTAKPTDPTGQSGVGEATDTTNGSEETNTGAIGDEQQQQQSSSSTTSSALVTPKILTAEELQQRQERRQELKKKIQAEREKKRREKSQRKERLQQEIKRLLGTKTIAGGVAAASDGSGAGVASSGAGGDLIGAGAAGGGVGGSGAGGSASSDEEFETIKQADLIASLARSYEKSILKTAKPNAGGG